MICIIRMHSYIGITLDEFYPRHLCSVALPRLREQGNPQITASPSSIARTEIFVKLPGNLGIVHAAYDDAPARERLLAGERDEVLDYRTDGLRAGFRRLNLARPDEVIREIANESDAIALQTAKFFAFLKMSHDVSCIMYHVSCIKLLRPDT
jgi:hypothetical protein